MRTITANLYKFHELNEAAQQFAINHLRSDLGGNMAEFDASDYRSTLKKIEEMFGINVYDWNIGYPGDYFRWEIEDEWFQDYDIENPKHLTRYLRIVSNRIYKGKYMGFYDGDRKVYHSKVLSYEDSYGLMDMWTDDAIIKTMEERFEFVRQGKTIEDFIETLLDRFFKEWKNDNDYCYSDEGVLEEIESNDLDFFENGTTCMNLN